MTRVKLYQTRWCSECQQYKPANHFGNFGICAKCRNRRAYEHRLELINQSIFKQEEQDYLELAINMIRSEYEK